MLLGAVWSPWVWPTLDGTIALALQVENLGWAAMIMTRCVLGVATLILAIYQFARSLLQQH